MTAADATGENAGRVHVYLDGRRVGTLARASDSAHRVTFTYDEAVLDDPTAAVSVRLPVRADAYDERDAMPCFENLLPDGDLRDLLATETHHHRSDVVGLLGVFGGECAGALALWPEGTIPPAVPRYHDCQADDVRAAFGVTTVAGDTGLLAVPQASAFVSGRAQGQQVWTADEGGGPVGGELTAMLRQARLSMSGAQEKLVLWRKPPSGTDGRTPPAYQLPVAGAPSTVLVKRERGRFPGLVQNEIAAMELMAAAGVDTATHTVCALDATVYETARFDRVLGADGAIRRRHAEDGCQLTGKSPRAKYAERNGPTYTELRTALLRHSADPLTDSEQLFRWAVANLAIGNRDAHAKNISLVYDIGGPRRLAPAYDVVCTVAYRRLDTVLPLSFGGGLHLEALNPGMIGKAGREFGLTPARAKELVEDVCRRLSAARADALQVATERAGAHAVLPVIDVAVRELTALTRRLLLGT